MDKEQTLILATNNPGKIYELKALLPGVHCIPQERLHIEPVEETGLSFVENAIIKARHASLQGQKTALADDSGLVVPTLGGQPGIYSARFAGEKATAEDNIDLLLKKLGDVPMDQRHAYFYCAIALIHYPEDPTPLIAVGKCSGYISQERIGENGFGYDSIFFLKEYNCTFAQLPSDFKNVFSHRAIALQQLKKLFWS